MAGTALPIETAEATVERWGRGLLAAAFAGGLAVVFAVAALAPDLAPWLPAGLLAGLLLWGLSRFPLGQLCGVLVFYAAAASQKEGIQAEEVGFAVYYLGFLAHWFAVRVLVRRERVVRSAMDALFVLLPAYAVASLGLSLLFGGTAAGAISDGVNFSMLLFYFPFREAVERHPAGPWVLVALALFLGSVAVVRNALFLQSAFSDAEYAWEIARGRATMNELLMLVPALGCVTFAARARALRPQALFAVGFAFFTVGVLLTQWRAAYLSIAAGLGLLFLLSSWKDRGRLATFLVVSLTVGGLIAFAFFGDLVSLLFLGIFDRVLSIGTATETDVSLLNRFSEWETVWALIRANPILGYGIGTEFGFFDAIFRFTWVKSYVHNGFLLLWYKLGVFGLGGMLYVWGRGARLGFRAARSAGLTPDERTLGLACGVVLFALVPSTLVSTTFSASDAQVTFALLVGVASGLAGRRRAGAGA